MQTFTGAVTKAGASMFRSHSLLPSAWLRTWALNQNHEPPFLPWTHQSTGAMRLSLWQERYQLRSHLAPGSEPSQSHL